MLPLEHITVVAVEQAVAAPFATRHLADLGARVIKIERPDGGDFARGYDAAVNGLSSHFVWLNRTKESLTLDLKRPEASTVMSRLLDRADVFVQNLAPGAASRLGMAAADLHARYPRLIVCDISGYGSSGPYANEKAYDLLVQSEVGLVSITGSEAEPAQAGVSVADIAARRGSDGPSWPGMTGSARPRCASPIAARCTSLASRRSDRSPRPTSSPG